MYKIIQHRKIWITLSSVAVVLSIVFLAMWGLNFGIDFTGGSLLEVKFKGERPQVNEIQDILSEVELSSLVVQPIGEEEVILRFQEISEETHQAVLKKLQEISKVEGKDLSMQAGSLGGIDGERGEETNPVIEDEEFEDIEVETDKNMENTVEELRFDSVGPSIGQELKQKSFYAMITVLVAIVLYIAWAFRKVSKPVASWKYGLTAIIALFHDVMIVLGVFALLGEFFNIEINSAFVAAILTVLGYSVNDTIVVFDRIRENLPRSDEDFEGTVNISVNQTIRRSINTSLTTLFVLVSILIFGGSTIRDFVLALSIGVLIGTYSSIFLASPVLVVWERFKK